jgi:hypothetical protein
VNGENSRAAAVHLSAQRIGEGEEAVLGCCELADSRRRRQPLAGVDEDHVLEPVEQAVGEAVRSHQVRLQLGLEDGGVVAARVEARGVDEDVDACRGRSERLRVLRHREIACDRARAPGALGDVGEALGVTSRDDQLRPGAGERDRDRPADATSGARDEREPAVEE